MDEEKLTDFKEDFALLIEAGFVAVKQLDEIGASRIFLAAQVLSPSHTAPRIGMGYIALNKLEIKQATKIFEEVVSQEPDNYLAQTFLGMCLLLTKGAGKKGEKIINDAIEKTSDPTIKSLGALALEWAEKDLSKKTKIPFFANQPDSPPEAEENASEAEGNTSEAEGNTSEAEGNTSEAS